ncbi:hypothetical protein KP509_32G066000 [Ceratopteris richardii]|uniref:Uncharacterized protein n=1 Tax=Ceratopteris richardii TaxID=49495 RepID=A0A8T2QVJ0_CERRI|nr:hypothetical protein KP509_32G066000 [Ceratopteris richardii]
MLGSALWHVILSCQMCYDVCDAHRGDTSIDLLVVSKFLRDCCAIEVKAYFD